MLEGDCIIQAVIHPQRTLTKTQDLARGHVQALADHSRSSEYIAILIQYSTQSGSTALTSTIWYYVQISFHQRVTGERIAVSSMGEQSRIRDES